MNHNITSHYMSLAAVLNTPFRLEEPLPVTIDELTEILCCTSRNVKFILRKLEEKALIEWHPGRGRGRVSQITFLRSIDDVLEDSFEELMGKGKIKEATALFGMAGGNEPLKERLFGALNKQMGFHSELNSPSGQDVLRMMRNRKLEKLDPAFVYTAFEAYLLGQICSTLVTYDAQSNTFLPGLAHMWECNNEHTHWVFYLRKGVRFHHGRVMTAKDVRATLQRLRDLDSSALCFFRDIINAESQGDYCIHFRLSQPNLFFMHLFSSIHMSIIPYDVDFSMDIIGTGPYRLKELRNDRLVLTAFDSYYGLRPLLDQVDIWFLPHDVSYDRQYDLPDLQREELDHGQGDDNEIDYPALGSRYLIFNFHKIGVHHQLAFRQALRLIYHQVTVIKELGGSRLTPADSFLPWNSKQRMWEEVPASAKEIKELLSASGYEGEPMTLAYMSKKEEREEAEWVQRRCADVGLTLKLRPFETFSTEGALDHAELLLAEEVLEDDWQWGMINYFKNEANYLHSLLLESQKTTIHRELEDFAQRDEKGRTELLDKAESLLRDNCWLLFGCHVNKRAQLNQSLNGLHTGVFGFLDISKLWIKTRVQTVDGS
ncbi:ABC transporter substrate-binding protein [Paenibacillus sp. NPDC057934]|uniref:ABC transporter substrate-binding protein n=1 Tax=Paenibacillus sp. NPDC057934 TaxID=3346282 RepID=UPI0036D884AF